MGITYVDFLMGQGFLMINAFSLTLLWWANHPAFRAGCLKLLKVQIKTQRPRLFLTLGPKVPPLLAAASPDLQEWNGRPRKSSCDPELHLEDLDRAPIFYDARIDLDDGSFHTAVITAVAHPSHPNSWRRKPLGFPEGRDGEMKLIRVGWDASRSLEPSV